MMDARFDAILTEVQSLPPSDRLRLIERVAATLQQDFLIESAYHLALQQTFGSLADDPMERPPQLPLEERESVE